MESRILESVGWGVFVVGRGTRQVIHWNRRMEELTGIAAVAACGQPVAQVFGYLQGIDVEGTVAEMIRSGCFDERCLRLVRPGGEVVFRHVRGDVLQGGDGGEEGVVVSVQDVTDRERMRAFMGQYLAREVAEMILASRPDQLLPGREVEVAVLVADMREFTGTAEGLTPEELFDTLNTYLGPMVEVIVRHRGTIDKFTGDGFMAVFGLAESDGSEARRALLAALDLEQRVAELRGSPEAEGVRPLGLGYGVHWGPATAGSLGSLSRMEYTVVGDTVNVAHRIQGLAGAGEILVTRQAARAAGPGFAWDPGRWERIRGRKAPLKIHLLQGREEATVAG
jgi:PAS domain S-box-containing protein